MVASLSQAFIEAMLGEDDIGLKTLKFLRELKRSLGPSYNKSSVLWTCFTRKNGLQTGVSGVAGLSADCAVFFDLIVSNVNFILNSNLY